MDDFEIINGADISQEIPNFCVYYLTATDHDFDYETRSEYTFSILAVDSLGMNSTSVATVLVVSLNEYPPKFIQDV